MRSVERYLLAWVAGALSLGMVIVALVGYLVTLDEMNEVFDADLKNVATAILAHHAPFDDRDRGATQAAPAQTTTLDDSDIVTVSWTRTGRLLFNSHPNVTLPFTDVEGLSRTEVDGRAWIVYTVVRGPEVAQAAQPVASRQEMAGESAAKVLPPMLVLVILTSALMVFSLRRGLRSLDAAARDVAVRSERSLEPIATDDLPREILPIVNSVNGLMEQLSCALTAQRRFLADAAHELRTPATALRLQLQLLERSRDDDERTAAMAALKAGIDRSQRLIEQLLQVARSGPDGEPMCHESVDLAELVRAVVGTLSVKADDRGLDLGALAQAAVMVVGDADQLVVLLNNLVENALRHAPRGGVVDVEATWVEGRPALRVVDNGPGIPEAERESVFDRFHRGTTADEAEDTQGSGLGLAIVRAIADRHGASVTLSPAPSQTGLQVLVVFPPPPSA